MEDVIFGGTQRRPQVGYAEVSLVLDNAEGRFGVDNAEVMITRRYYRSGESEYYINRALVRLKDLSETLMDTGLGREGYCIIGQGRIAEILSSKSKDRREIFEEAAGISRYRHRKEEAERKLQQTDENLVRIGDKISELELQIEPLREQAESAKKYLILRDELRGVEIAVWLRELDALKGRAEKAKADHLSAKQAFDDATVELDAGFKKSEALSERSRECDLLTESVRGAISSAELRQGDIDSSVAVLRSQLEGNASQIERLDVEIRTQDDRHDGVGLQIREREKRLEAINAEKDALIDKLSALDSKLSELADSAGQSSSEISSLLRSESEGLSRISDAKATVSALASQAQELLDMENSVKQELSAAVTFLAERTQEKNRSEEELAKERESVQSLGNVTEGLRLKLENRGKKSEMAAEKLARISLEKRTLESRRSLLAEMEKDYQGFSKAVKTVMQEHARGTLKNIHGTVAGLIRTSDRYATAVETALGGAVQHIIVDTEEDAKAAIGMLKQRDSGRATFLPLSTIKGNTINAKEYLNEKGFEGIAIDLVQYDQKYSSIYANLLGRVLITDDLSSAISISRKHNRSYKTVTLDGQLINVGGSMTGGSAPGGAGILSRANELDQLETRINAVLTALSAAERENAECLREKKASEYELEAAKSELRACEDSLIRREGEAEYLGQVVSTAENAINTLQQELESLNGRIRDNGKQTESAKTRILDLESENAIIREKAENAIQGQHSLSEQRDKINLSISELRAEGASLDAERDAVSDAVAQLSALRDEMLGSRERQLQTIDELRLRSSEILAEIAGKEQMSIIEGASIDEQKLALARLNEQKLEIEEQRNGLNKEIQAKNHSILDLERECARLEQRTLTAQMEEKQILDKMWDNYELGRSAAIEAAAKIESVAEAQRRIATIKEQIASLGNPNIGAINEFDRVNARYGFLASQREDVDKAKKEIENIIEEITAQMKDIFIREFMIINESFERTFQELFGGGHATLELENPDDVLECGIEIHVQPPGKSLKTLTLLSGGEKSFVAIAIYFAILTVKPPPFVVMDEIEAALDDANVLRFASFLRRMSENTQMIVITHKRATMEEADVLFGVTMQELGVSNVLKIDLTEAEKHISRKNAI